MGNRDKDDQPQGSTPASRTAPSVSAEEELDEAQAQLAATLEAAVSLVRGAGVSESFDKDRLLQFALVFQEEGSVIPTHACNRLYSNRKDMVLARGERSLWLDMLLQQARTSPVNWVTPGWFIVAGNRAEPSEELASEVAYRLHSTDPALANGALICLSRGRMRPREYWDSTTDLEAVATLWRDAVSPNVDPKVLSSYLLAVSEPEDEALLIQLGNELDDDYAKVFHAVVASIQHDYTALNELVDRRNFNLLQWPKEIVAGHLDGLSPANLREILSWSDDEVLRSSVFDMLLDTDAIDNPSFISAVTSNKNEGLSAQAMAVMSNRSAPARTDLITALEATKAPNAGQVIATLRLPEISIAGLTQEDLNELETWETVSWSGDPLLMDHARLVIVSDGSAYSRTFESFNEHQVDSDKRAEVVDFVRAKGRAAALRLFQRVSSNVVTPKDVELVATELERKHWVTSDPDPRVEVCLKGVFKRISAL